MTGIARHHLYMWYPIKSDREKFTYAVERGDVSIEDTGMIELTDDYSHLSAGGFSKIDNNIYYCVT